MVLWVLWFFSKHMEEKERAGARARARAREEWEGSAKQTSIRDLFHVC